MSTATALCPRCQAEVKPSMARCRDCGQVLARSVTAPSETASATRSSDATQVTAPRRAAESIRAAKVPPEQNVQLKLESDTNSAVVDRGTPLPPSNEKIRVPCVCGAMLRINAELAGKRIKCPKCSTSVAIPRSSSASRESAVVDRPSAAPASSRASGVKSAQAGINATADQQALSDEIESAAKMPPPADAVSPANGHIAARKLKSLQHLLETANVLNDSETIARRQALLELGQSQDPRVLEILLEHSQDNSSVIRDGAITALGDFGDPAGVPSALRALLDREPDVVRAAFTALKRIGDSRVVRPLLCYGLERPQWKPLSNDTLVRLGSRVVSEILRIVQGNDPGLSLDAIMVLGRIGDQQSVPPLIACLDHFSDLLKAHVIEALALIGDPRAVPHLLRALEDSHAAIRANAAAGLVRMADSRALGPLIKALQDEDSDVRCYAATALGELGAAKAAPALVKVLSAWESLVDLDAPYLEAVVESLGKLGDASVVPELIPLLQSPHDGVLLKTILALKKLRDPSAAQALVALLHVPKPTVRRRAVETLGLTSDAALVPVIGGVLRDDPAPEVRAAAARALGELKSKEGVSYLEDALHQEFLIRCQAVIALGAVHDKRSLPALMAMLKDSAPEVRYHAINAITKFKDPKTLRALAVLLEDTDPMVRNGAAKAVEEFGPAVEDKAVKQIIHRARARDLLGKLIPNWVLLFVPRSAATRRAIASVVAASLLLGFLIKTNVIGGPSRQLVRGNVQALALSPDGETLVAERTLGMFEVWDVNAKKVKEQVGVEEGVRSPLFRAKDGVVVLSGSSVVPWSLRGTPEFSAGWNEHKLPILKSAVTPDGRYAVTLCKDLLTVVWDLEAGRKKAKFDIDGRYSSALSISPDGKWVAGGSRQGEAGVWDVESEQRIKELPGVPASKAIVATAFSPDGHWLVGADEDGNLRLWDLTGDNAAPQTLAPPAPMRVIGLRFLSDSQRIVTASAGGDVRVWPLDGESRSVVSAELDQVDAFAMSADDKRIAVGGTGNSAVLVFDLESGDLHKKLDVLR